MLLPPDPIRTAETVAKCSREGAGIGEAIAILAVVVLAVLLLTLVGAAIVGAVVARKRGRPAWKGALIGSGGVLGGLLALALLVFGAHLMREWADRRERDQVDQWLQPLHTAGPGSLAAALEDMQREAPRYPYARARLGYELQQRLLASDTAWSEDDLTAAATYTPAPQDMHAAVVWARHGLPGLERALAEIGSAPADVRLLAHTAAWRCSSDVPLCRRQTTEAAFRQLEERVVARMAEHERQDVLLTVRNVRQRAFGEGPATP